MLGDTTEGALLVVAAKAGLDMEAEAAAAPRVTVFPFDSRRKLMTTVHRIATGHQACVKEPLPNCWRAVRTRNVTGDGSP
ncbi:hypothetical protein ACFQ60_01530 [Streptomyces zhihengii]